MVTNDPSSRMHSVDTLERLGSAPRVASVLVEALDRLSRIESPSVPILSVYLALHPEQTEWASVHLVGARSADAWSPIGPSVPPPGRGPARVRRDGGDL